MLRAALDLDEGDAHAHKCQHRQMRRNVRPLYPYSARKLDVEKSMQMSHLQHHSRQHADQRQHGDDPDLLLGNLPLPVDQQEHKGE
ncbi:hypothetical protein D3C73_1512770 [compost metagenome]